MVVSFTVKSDAVQRKLRNASPKLRAHVYKHLKTRSKPAVEAKYTQFAPKRTGAIASDKRTRVFKENMRFQFIAGAQGRAINTRTGFNYGDWVLGKIPTITITKQNKYFQVGQTIRYGDPSAKNAKGLPVRWGAGLNWFRGVENFSRRKIPQDVNQAVKEFVKEMNS